MTLGKKHEDDMSHNNVCVCCLDQNITRVKNLHNSYSKREIEKNKVKNFTIFMMLTILRPCVPQKIHSTDSS